MIVNLSSTPPVHKGDHIRITHLPLGADPLHEGDVLVADWDYPDGDVVGFFGTSACLVATMGDRWEIVKAAQ